MLDTLITSIVIPLLGELLKQVLDNWPAIAAQAARAAQTTLTDSPADPALTAELTDALDHAIASGLLPPP